MRFYKKIGKMSCGMKYLHPIKKFFNQGNVRSQGVKKNIAATFLNKCFAIGITLNLVPLTIHYLNPSQYGIWLTLSSIVSWISYFDVGFSHGFRNRFAQARAQENNRLARCLVSTCYVVMTLLFFLLFLAGVWLNTYIDWVRVLNLSSSHGIDLTTVFFVLILFFCLQMVLNIFNTMLTADQKPALASFFSTFGQFMALAGIYLLIRLSEPNMVYLAFVLSGIPCLTLLLISVGMYATCYKSYAPTLKYVDFRLTKNILGLGGGFFIVQLSMLFIFQFINIILSRLEGPDAVTRYNITYKYFNIIFMVTTIILMPFWSAFTDAYTRHDFEWMKSVYRKLSRYWFFALGGYLILLLFSPWAYKLWLGGNITIPFSHSAMMGIYILLLSRANLYMYLINGMGKIRLQLLIYVFFAFISIPLMLLGCRLLGVIGILCVVSLVYLIQIIFGHIQLSKIINQTASGIWLK